MKRHPKAIRLTDAQETEIRRRFFKLHHDPQGIASAYGIGLARMRKIVGGPLYRKSGIERAYS